MQNCLRNGIVNLFIEKPVTIHKLCQVVRDELLTYQAILNKK